MIKHRRFPLFISAVVLSIILLSSCKGDKKLHYVVKTPADWIRKDTITREGSKKSTFDPPKYDTSYFSGENIKIVCFKFKNLDEYVRLLYQDLKKTAVFFNEEKREKIKINGLDARYVLAEISLPKNPDVVVEQKCYFIKDRSTLFMIICTAPKKGIENLQPIIDELLASFKTEEDK